TMSLIPAATCVSISFLKAESSTPPSRNGVTTAVNVPRNISFKPQIYTDETQMRKESDLKSREHSCSFVAKLKYRLRLQRHTWPRRYVLRREPESSTSA